jgi:hypothetical protein
MAEHSAVNRRVVGSSPTCGANFFLLQNSHTGVVNPHESGLQVLPIYWDCPLNHYLNSCWSQDLPFAEIRLSLLASIVYLTK